MNITTLHEAQQSAELRKPLAWPIHTTCNGNCMQGRACDCSPAVVTDDAEEWEPATWKENLMFWLPVLFCTALLGFFVAVLMGWRP